jgi:hypothetical protein
LVRRRPAIGYNNLLLPAHKALDLTDAAAVRQFFSWEHPQFVFPVAAKGAGMLANSSLPPISFGRIFGFRPMSFTNLIAQVFERLSLVWSGESVGNWRAQP